MSEEQVRAEKQQYLREAIMEKGYDIEKFVTYLQGLRENGDDIDNWTFEEIKDIAQKFIKLQEQGARPATFEDATSVVASAPATVPPPPVQPIPSSVPSANQYMIPLPPTPDEPAAAPAAGPSSAPAAAAREEVKGSPLKRFNILREYPDAIATAELPTTELTVKKVSIKVLDPVIKQGGIFSSTTITYMLETQPMGWQVGRSYSDCMWLREQLQKHFPGCTVPPLNKKGAKNKTASKSIMKRVRWLQQFFTELQRDQTLRSSEIFYCFFRLPQKPDFEAKKKELTKAPVAKSIFEMKHFTGKVDTTMSERKVAMAKNVGIYAQSSQNLYSQLLVATDSTVKVMLLLSDSLARNADLFKQFSQLHVGVESAELTDLFLTLKGVHTAMSDIYAKQAGLVKDRMGEFFKYYKDELDSLKELCATQEKICAEYMKKEEQLYAKKEKLFDEGKMPAWDMRPEDVKAFDQAKLKADKTLAMPLILPKDTKKLQDQYVIFAYYTNRVLEAGRRLMAKNYRTMRKHFKSTADDQVGIIKQMMEYWQGVSDHLNAKVSKLPKKERSEILHQLKLDLLGFIG